LKTTKKLVSPLLLVLLLVISKNRNHGTKEAWEDATPNDDYLLAPITQPVVTSEEIKPHFLSLVQQNQFGGSATEEEGMHVNTFTKICGTMQIKNVE
jgi:hypothetical protein